MSSKGMIKAWWCTKDPKNVGWFAEESKIDGAYIGDSQKITFPVDLDKFSRDEHEELASVLCEAFPDHAIVIEHR